MRPSLPALGTLALLGALLTGCGGDDDGGPDAAGGDGGTSSFCERAAAVEEQFRAVDAAAGPDPELFRDVSATFAGLADDAPAEISDDMETVATALAEFADVFEGLDPEDPESLAVLEEESARIAEESGGDLDEASENVEEYLQEECDVDLDGSGGEGADGATEDGPTEDGSGGAVGGETGTELDEEPEG